MLYVEAIRRHHVPWHICFKFKRPGRQKVPRSNAIKERYLEQAGVSVEDQDMRSDPGRWVRLLSCECRNRLCSGNPNALASTIELPFVKWASNLPRHHTPARKIGSHMH